MAYNAAHARQELLDAVAVAIEHLGRALAGLGAAYELLDEHTADRLEEDLFRPVQSAYGRAQRTYAGFAERHGLATRTFAPPAPRGVSAGAASLVADAVDAVSEADTVLSTLQDSMMPVEVGDADVRAGLADVRTVVGDVRARARELTRGLGR